MRRLVIFAAAIALMLGLSACGVTDQYAERQRQNESVIVENSQEVRNLKEKIRRDETSADKIGYVYVMSFGKFVGYYTIKGKISSNGSQIAPEMDVICRYSTGESCQAVDGPQDDNTYGAGDPGIFFFTTEGAMVVTSLDYLYADQPIAAALDVPKLNPVA